MRRFLSFQYISSSISLVVISSAMKRCMYSSASAAWAASVSQISWMKVRRAVLVISEHLIFCVLPLCALGGSILRRCAVLQRPDWWSGRYRSLLRLRQTRYRASRPWPCSCGLWFRPPLFFLDMCKDFWSFCFLLFLISPLSLVYVHIIVLYRVSPLKQYKTLRPRKRSVHL